MKKQSKLTIISFIGYLLILIGLLFVTVPLINRTANEISYNKRLEEFEKEQAQRPKEEIEEENKAAEKYNELVKNSDTSILDPFTTEDNQNRYNYFKNSNEVFAYLEIPKLGKNLPIYLDATLDHISRGVAQVEGTSIPIGGKGTRSVIAGHRDWWGDTMFLYVDELVEGDDVYVKRATETLHYKVSDKEVIGPYDWDRLDKRGDQDVLTLLTCSPFYPPRPDRLLVNCIRYEEPTEASGEEEKKEEKNETQAPVKRVQRASLLTKIGAGLGIILIILLLVRLFKRINYTRKNK